MGDDDLATYAAFGHAATDIEERVALLLADLDNQHVERTHHG